MTTRPSRNAFNLVDNLFYTSVRDHKAKGDGTTDDTAAFTAALAVGKPVYIPPGTYIVSGLSITADCEIFGAGSQSIIKLKSASDTHVISQAAMTTARSVHLHDFAIDGNKSGQSISSIDGIHLGYQSRSVISDIAVSNVNGNGIYVSKEVTTAINSCIIKNCSVTTFTKNGIYCEGTVNIASNFVYSSDALASPGNGISLYSASATKDVSFSTVEGNRCNNNVGAGILVDGSSYAASKLRILDNTCNTNTSDGIRLYFSKENSMVGNVCSANGNDGIRLEGTEASYNTLVSCNCYANSNYGLREVVATGSPNYNNYLSCIITGQGTNAKNTITMVGTYSRKVYCTDYEASAGLRVGNVASADVASLDYYLEGTFTPVVAGLTTAGAGTYTLQYGKYTRIGNKMYIHGKVTWTAHTGTGSMKITGLPVASESNAANDTLISVTSDSMTFVGVPVGIVRANTSEMLIYVQATAANLAGLAMDTAMTLYFNGFYELA